MNIMIKKRETMKGGLEQDISDKCKQQESRDWVSMNKKDTVC